MYLFTKINQKCYLVEISLSYAFLCYSMRYKAPQGALLNPVWCSVAHIVFAYIETSQAHAKQC